MDSVSYSFNVFNILIIAGAIQGFLFSSFVLLSKKYREKTFWYLALLVLVLSLSNTYYWFRDTGLAFFWEHYRALYIPWDLLILPCFYFFVSEYLGYKKKYRKYLIIPFGIRLIAQIVKVAYQHTSLSNFKTSDKTIFVLKRIDEYATIIFILLLLFLIFKLVFSYEKNHLTKKTIKKPTKWLKQLLMFGALLSIFWLTVLLLGDTILPKISSRNKYYIIWLGLSVLIYWLGYLGIYHLGLFNQRKDLRKFLASSSSNQNNKSKNKELFKDIDEIIKNKKLYLNPNLSLQILETEFSLSNGYLSQIINSNTNSNFSNYINALRIENAKTILTNPNYKNYTVVSIALESGFNSKSAFYNAFKQHVGISPTEYRKTQKLS